MFITANGVPNLYVEGTVNVWNFEDMKTSPKEYMHKSPTLGGMPQIILAWL